MYHVTIARMENGKWARHLYCVADSETVITDWDTKKQAINGHD